MVGRCVWASCSGRAAAGVRRPARVPLRVELRTTYKVFLVAGVSALNSLPRATLDLWLVPHALLWCPSTTLLRGREECVSLEAEFFPNRRCDLCRAARLSRVELQAQRTLLLVEGLGGVVFATRFVNPWGHYDRAAPFLTGEREREEVHLVLQGAGGRKRVPGL